MKCNLFTERFATYEYGSFNNGTISKSSYMVFIDICIYICTRCDQKITVLFKFREKHMFDFHIFVLLCWHTCLLYIYVDNISHFGLSVCFWQIKGLVVFWCALQFFTIRKNGSKNNGYFLIIPRVTAGRQHNRDILNGHLVFILISYTN